MIFPALVRLSRVQMGQRSTAFVDLHVESEAELVEQIEVYLDFARCRVDLNTMKVYRGEAVVLELELRAGDQRRSLQEATRNTPSGDAGSAGDRSGRNTLSGLSRSSLQQIKKPLPRTGFLKPVRTVRKGGLSSTKLSAAKPAKKGRSK